MSRPTPGWRQALQRVWMVMTIVFFIIGLSVILSCDWITNSGFASGAGTTIFFAILVAAIICIA